MSQTKCDSVFNDSLDDMSFTFSTNQSITTRRRYKKFCVQNYRQLLKAWIKPSNESDGEEEVAGSQTNDNQSVVRLNGNQLAEIDNNLVNKTIELNDSLESIPETPEIVDKRQTTDKSKKKSKKRFVSKFIDFESEVVFDSSDSFSDDIECTQRDVNIYSQSCLDDNVVNDSQPIGLIIGGIDSRDAEDMQSVYLRSVREESLGNTHKYKLQYNYDPTIDVYSQEPNHSEQEDYEFDSFCVPNDCLILEDTPKATTSAVRLSESSSPMTTVRPNKRFKRIIFSP